MRRTLASPIFAISSNNPSTIFAEVLSASIRTARRGERSSEGMTCLRDQAACRLLVARPGQTRSRNSGFRPRQPPARRANYLESIQENRCRISSDPAGRPASPQDRATPPWRMLTKPIAVARRATADRSLRGLRPSARADRRDDRPPSVQCGAIIDACRGTSDPDNSCPAKKLGLTLDLDAHWRQIFKAISIERLQDQGRNSPCAS